MDDRHERDAYRAAELRREQLRQDESRDPARLSDRRLDGHPADRRSDAARGDVQVMSDFELQVYEVIAKADNADRAAEVDELATATGRSAEDVRNALHHLMMENHVRATTHGYVLGPHDWAP